jgi:hypothetical protein
MLKTYLSIGTKAGSGSLILGTFGYDFRIEGTNLHMISKVVFVSKHFWAKRTWPVGRPGMHDQHVLLHVAFIDGTFAAKVALKGHLVPQLNGSQEQQDLLLVYCIPDLTVNIVLIWNRIGMRSVVAAILVTFLLPQILTTLAPTKINQFALLLSFWYT